MANHKTVQLTDVLEGALCYTVAQTMGGTANVGLGQWLLFLWEGEKMKDEVSGDVVRVLIADDEPRVRSALRLLLRYYPGVVVTDEADNIGHALELTARQRPDLVLLDWELPGCHGATVLEELRAARQGLVVIALSGRPEARRAALDAGVDAFVSKGDPPERLLSMLEETLRTAARDGSVGRCPSGATVSHLLSL